MTSWESEAEALHHVAEEYREKGYTVIFTPSAEQLPAPLENHALDLIALSDDDKVVIEIHRTVRGDDSVRSIAEAAEVAGWRFDLVIVQDPSRSKQSRETLLLPEIGERLQQADAILSLGHLEPALITAWSGAEALLRRLLVAEEEGLLALSPARLTKEAIGLGLIGRPHYEVLARAAQARNRIVHGFRSTHAESRPNREFVEGLLATCAQLLRRLSGTREGKETTVAEMVEWFLERFQDPAHGVPYETREGGYQYFNGGPYDAWDELSSEFTEATEAQIEEAAQELLGHGGPEWVRIEDY